jgi:hypothetical protein
MKNGVPTALQDSESRVYVGFAEVALESEGPERPQAGSLIIWVCSVVVSQIYVKDLLCIMKKK